MGLFLAVGIVALALPAFNGFLNQNLSFLLGNYQVLLGLVGITVAVGILAGSYPALFISRFQPVAVLKGKFRIGRRASWIRESLVVFQFAISIFFIIGTFVAYEQMLFMRTRELGYKKEQVVVLPIFSLDHSAKRNPETRLMKRYQTVKQAFLQHPNVVRATASHTKIPWTDNGSFRSVIPEGVHNQIQKMHVHKVDADFLETFEIDLVAGRNFIDHQMDDAPMSFIINKTAAQRLGWEHPVGKIIEVSGEGRGTIVGVVKDFYMGTGRNKIEPFVLSTKFERIQWLSLRIRAGNIPETISFLKTMWQHYLPERPFQFFFVDDRLNQLYQQEQRFGQLFAISAILAFFVACLGLVGLASFTTEQRKKEVGIRKVLGASVRDVMILIVKHFIKPILVANIIAWPIAYYFMNRWLEDFAYRIQLGADSFIFSGTLTFIIALLAISFQVLKSARANPVDTLRQE